LLSEWTLDGKSANQGVGAFAAGSRGFAPMRQKPVQNPAPKLALAGAFGYKNLSDS
jgi:hypothetical protein